NATLSCNSKTQSVYSVTIQATSGSLSHSTNVSFAFGTPPNFEVSSTQPLTVEAGSNTTSTITVNLIHGFNGTVVLTEASPSNLDRNEHQRHRSRDDYRRIIEWIRRNRDARFFQSNWSHDNSER